MSAFVNEVTDAGFENDVLKASQPVLVDFWAAWCAPCRMLTPTVEAVAEQYQGKAKIVKLNVDENPEAAMRYGIKGIPTLVLFNKGKEADRIVGVPSNAKDFIGQLLDKHLA
jgi:thioredoxin 1